MGVFQLRQKDFEGLIPSVGGFLGLNSERELTNCVTFDDFKLKLSHYILKESKGSEEVIAALKAVKYGTKNMPAKVIVKNFKTIRNPRNQRMQTEKKQNILREV